MSEGYAGEISPTEAWRRLEREPEAILLDVRTEPEWRYVGLPNLAPLGKEVVLVGWQLYPDMRLNDRFLQEIRQEGVSAEQPLFIICRSGARSRHAAIALTAAGYRHCYNVTTGFEGPLDETSHRGRAGGWKAEGLPWRQE